MELPDVAKIERLTLKPGDRLVLSFDRYLSDAEYDGVREQVRLWGLPPGGVLVLDGGAKLRVLEVAAE